MLPAQLARNERHRSGADCRVGRADSVDSIHLRHQRQPRVALMPHTAAKSTDGRLHGAHLQPQAEAVVIFYTLTAN